MGYRNRRSGRSGVGYTAVSMAIVMGIALATVYGADRRADATVASASASVDHEGAHGLEAGGTDAAARGERAHGSSAPGAGGSAAQRREGDGNGTASESRAGRDAAAVIAAADPVASDDALPVEPLVEGSAAERAQSPVVSRGPERAPSRGDTGAAPAPEPRSEGHPVLAAEGPHRRVLPPLGLAEIERLELAARRPGPLEVGPVRETGGTPEPVELPVPGGEERLRAFVLRSEGAASLRLHFSRFEVGDARVIVYGGGPKQKVVLGPFSGRGPGGQGAFWTGVVPGDEAVVEISGGNGAAIEVDRALHAHLGGGVEQAAKSGDGLLTCHEDVMCHSVDQIARDAVGQLSYMKDGAGYVCTGTLIADEDDETVVPYLLTARHCIGTQAVADTLNVTWLYQSSSCGAAAPSWASSPMSPNGADLVRTNSGNDMTLLRLRDPIPAGVGLAGWTTSTGVGGAYGVHHPWGSHKRYTDLNAVGFCPNCLCKDPTDYDFYDMQEGFTQGGSSGSAVFDGQGRIAGQLWGSCSKGLSHPDDMTCGTTDDYWAVYGEFQTTHGKIQRWLEIGGTIRVDAAVGAGGLGTPTSPFAQVAAARDFAWDGSRIKLAAGTYAEPIQLDKAVTLVADGGVVTIAP